MTYCILFLHIHKSLVWYQCDTEPLLGCQLRVTCGVSFTLHSTLTAGVTHKSPRNVPLAYLYNTYVVTSLLFHGREVFISNLPCRWLNGLWQHHLQYRPQSIRFMSRQQNGLSSHCQSDLFRQPVQAQNKENFYAAYRWSFMRKSLWSLVDSPQKGPAMWKVFPCHDIIMDISSHGQVILRKW